MPLTQDLGRFVAEIRFERLPAKYSPRKTYRELAGTGS
jgi:hypothetical protein